MPAGVDTDICCNVNCEHYKIIPERDGNLCCELIVEGNKALMIFGGNNNPIPDNCPYKAIMILSSKKKENNLLPALNDVLINKRNK